MGTRGEGRNYIKEEVKAKLDEITARPSLTANYLPQGLSLEFETGRHRALLNEEPAAPAHHNLSPTNY